MTRKTVIDGTHSVWDGEYRQNLLSWDNFFTHLTFFYDFTSSYEQPTVIELGVRGGYSTRAFLSGVHNSGGKLYSCDLNPPHEVPQSWYSVPEWVFIQGDDVSDRVLQQMPAQADVVFIDTIHTYEHTTRELECYVPRVTAGGAVLLHDTELNEAVNPGCKKHDVYRAIDDYCRRNRLAWENHTANWGLGIIWK